MSLMSELNAKQWKKATRTEISGLAMFTIVRSEMVENGRFKYAVKEVTDDGGRMAMVTLEGARGNTDPLKKIRNALLTIDAEKNEITAIDLDGDCVIKA